MKKQENRYSGINIEILKLADYSLEELDVFIEQFKDFRNQLKQKEVIEKYGKISNTQTLIDELNKLSEFDLDTMEEIAYRIEMEYSDYSAELKACILDDIEVIKFNNIEKTTRFNVILEELIQQIKYISEDYGITIEEKELEK